MSNNKLELKSLRDLLIQRDTREGMLQYMKMYPGIDNPFRAYEDCATKGDIIRRLKAEIDWYNNEINKIKNPNPNNRISWLK